MAKIKANIKSTEVEVSNLEKIFYPKTKFTKGDVINYYASVSKYLLPYLKNKPITLKRFPDGVDGIFFTRSSAHLMRPHGSRPPRCLDRMEQR